MYGCMNNQYIDYFLLQVVGIGNGCVGKICFIKYFCESKVRNCLFM